MSFTVGATITGAETALYSFGTTGDGANPGGSLIQASDGNLYGMTNTGGDNNVGTVFKITPGGTVTVLHSFVGGTGDGAIPTGSLIQASNGDLYGMTRDGGANNVGTVFKITGIGTSTATESVLHSFAGGTGDGANPNAGLIQASDGNLYGMTLYGGANNLGTLFKITPAGAETIQYSFAGGTGDGAFPLCNLIQTSNGNLYGMTYGGGANNVGTVFKITGIGTSTVTESVLHSFAGGTGDGANPNGNSSLVQASDGNFYGMTLYGGANNVGTVFKITPAGVETVLHSFAGGTGDGALPYCSLIQASDGNLYGMTNTGGANNVGTVFKITPSGTVTVLHSFAGSTSDGANPYGDLIQASDGNLYGMTWGGGANNMGTVFKIN